MRLARFVVTGSAKNAYLMNVLSVREENARRNAVRVKKRAIIIKSYNVIIICAIHARLSNIHVKNAESFNAKGVRTGALRSFLSLVGINYAVAAIKKRQIMQNVAFVKLQCVKCAKKKTLRSNCLFVGT